MSYGGECSLRGKTIDRKESLYMGDEHGPNHGNLGLPTFGSNVFPDRELPEMRSLYITYNDAMKDLGNRMMRILSLALDLPEGCIEDIVTEHDPIILPRLVHYFPRENDDSANGDSWGIGEHSDYGLWTMVLTNAPGLEFQHPQTKTWHAAPFIENSIIMNVGDVLDRLTAGRFVSPYHRVRSLSSDRLGLPFFYDPSWTALMKTLPIENPERYKTPERDLRWHNTKIRCEFDGSVQYAEFLAKKVAKVFPDLIPEHYWKNLKSTSQPSTRHLLVVKSPDVVMTNKVRNLVEAFYKAHTEIKESHGWKHVAAVLEHARKAVAAQQPPLSARQVLFVLVAALLHDVDDHKYFSRDSHNAMDIMIKAGLDNDARSNIREMISYVSCSVNRNAVPDSIRDSGEYWRLIPRWADRLEAVGAKGVSRCYQYNKESGQPLSSPRSPRAMTEADVWKFAKPERFENYRGDSIDMISHYYDKLLHVACPPADIVRNSYLEAQAKHSSKELVEVCLRFGKTGKVDEEYLANILC